jgi:hypothetical protein
MAITYWLRLSQSVTSWFVKESSNVRMIHHLPGQTHLAQSQYTLLHPTGVSHEHKLREEIELQDQVGSI